MLNKKKDETTREKRQLTVVATVVLIADVPVCHHNQIRGGEVSEVGGGG